MKKNLMLSVFALIFVNFGFAGGYEIGDKVSDFSLKNLNGKMVSLKDFKDVKGIVVIFTDNHCTTSKDYEDLLIKLDTKYKEKGFPFVAINPSNPEVNPKESHVHMVMRAEKKGFTFPYLADPDQSVARTFGVTKIPVAYLLNKVGDDFIVSYIGQIDPITDYGAKDKKLRYLSNAIDALLMGNDPDPSHTRPGGCLLQYATD